MQRLAQLAGAVAHLVVARNGGLEQRERVELLVHRAFDARH
jgi:hypothetical protein